MKKIFLIILTVLFVFIYSTGESSCPGGNILTKMTTEMTSFKSASPLDHSKINSAGALINKAGTKLTVSLSNMNNLSINQLANDFVLPIKKKSEFIADIEFRNKKDKIRAGTYSGSSGYGKPFWVFAEVKVHKGEKGVIVSLGIREGEATISKLTSDRICGKFELRSKKGSSTKSIISGEFNVNLKRSRW